VTSPNAIKKNGYYTPTEAAAKLGISRQSVVSAIHRGEIRAEKVGPARRFWAIRPAEMQRLKKARR
jgi:excisionase family DNA binding protein